MKKITFRTVASLITASAVAGVVALAIPADAAVSVDSRSISVSGTGTVSVVPDAVRFNATVTVVGASNAEALAGASKSAAAVRAALKANVIATKDIRSASISVYPEYTWTQETGTKITGYRASQTFDVLVRKSSVAGTVIEAVVSAGGNDVQLGGVIPVVLDSAAAAEGARSAAVANAKSKAMSYAKLLGVTLGKVITLDEISSPVYSTPFAMKSSAMASDAAPLEVDLGEQDVTVSISVKWELN